MKLYKFGIVLAFLVNKKVQMNKILMILSVVFFTTNTYAQDWQQEKQSNGITISTKASDEYRMKASKAEMNVSESVETVVNAIYNVNTYLDWMPDCAEIKVLKTISDNELIYYGLYETPWPSSNRDLVLHLKKVKIDNGYKIVMTNKPDYIAASDDIVRIPIYFGEWTITRTGNVTRVNLEYQTDPGGNVPDWMIQGAAIKSPYNMFEALKTEIK